MVGRRAGGVAVKRASIALAFAAALSVLGLAAGVTPVVGAVIGIIAACCIVSSMRRFWRSDHRARWGYTAFGTAMLVFLLAMSVRDIAQAL